MEKNNLSLWAVVRTCPKEAQRTITGGRLNNFTDISPIWRMKVLTEQFGPCGFGWYYEITDKWNEADGLGQIATFVQINLYVKNGDEWSKPIVGMGGSAFVKKEGSNLHTSDEAYKMALTDAISVSCKALGIAADIYWSKDTTKYTTGEELMTKVQETTFESLGITKKAVASHFKVEVEEITKKQADKAIAMQLDAIKRSKKTEVKDAEHTNE